MSSVLLFYIDTNIVYSSSHDDLPQCLCFLFQVDGSFVYSSSHDGLIQVYELREKELHVMFVSENVKSTSGSQLPWRPIRSMCVTNQKIYFGDDGMNVKALDWKKGNTSKCWKTVSESLFNGCSIKYWANWNIVLHLYLNLSPPPPPHFK